MLSAVNSAWVGSVWIAALRDMIVTVELVASGTGGYWQVNDGANTWKKPGKPAFSPGRKPAC
ncbi:hypothetical protein TSA66_12695 [Noviherbaspirillum autotrophicum]|uniref:Uncharacterized protein n=2 Tax=Noviherbaspirillum autotrophicum TaxID=709839 RepID=A0A0C1Y313_9BURK|nr:hypothetical protein TSA66_12695 [Noviherbaspirillum autotrophicum]